MWEAAREILGRTLKGCGHRQIGMCLRAEHDVRITNKTVLKMMREMGLRCLIRRKKKPGAYSSYKGDVGKIFPNKLHRDFCAERPMEKLGTDVTEFRQSWGKAYLALVSDFYTKEIVAYAVSEHPDLAQDWIRTYKATGLPGLLTMGTTCKTYDCQACCCAELC